MNLLFFLSTSKETKQTNFVLCGFVLSGVLFHSTLPRHWLGQSGHMGLRQSDLRGTDRRPDAHPLPRRLLTFALEPLISIPRDG